MALDSFISNLRRKDVARQNRFSASITGPSGFANRDLNMMCESATFPGQNMRTSTDSLRQGPVREFVHGVTYGPITLSFICTNGLDEKSFFENWQGLFIFDKETYTYGYYKDYIGQIVLTQMDRTDAPRYTVTIHEAYPKTITAQDFSMGSNDSYQTISIEFAFHHWDSKLTAPSGGMGHDFMAGMQVDNFGALAGTAAAGSGVARALGQLAGGHLGSAVARGLGGSFGGFAGALVSAATGRVIGQSAIASSLGGVISKAGSFSNIAGMVTGTGMNTNASSIFNNAAGAINANKSGLSHSTGSLDSVAGVRRQAGTNVLKKTFGTRTPYSGQSTTRGNTTTSGSGIQ